MLARKSPSAFMAVALGIEMAQVHVGIQRHLSAHDDCYVEEHRGIGKTTQFSGRVAWEIGRNPDIRVKYVQHIKEKASETVRAIRHIMELDTYRAVFPHIKPDSENWGSESFTVKRQRWGRDPTVQAEGINGRAGGRFDLLIADDICDIQNAIQKPMEREKVKEAWNTNWLPMADHSRGKPRTWKCATPYHVSDITADWRRMNGANGSMLRQPVVGYISPWSEVWTEEILKAEKEKMGPIAFGRAYLLEPVTSELLVFSPEWLDPFIVEDIPPGLRGTFECAIDWAYTDVRSGEKLKGDPDYSVCLIGFKTESGHIYIVDMVRERTAFPTFARNAIDRCVANNVKHGWAEGNGPQRELVRSFNALSHFPVSTVERTRDKMTRATACQPFVMGGRLHLMGYRGQDGKMRPLPSLQPLYDEMTTFPAGDHDDCADCVVDLIGADARGVLDQLYVDKKPVRRMKQIAGNIYGHPPEEWDT